MYIRALSLLLLTALSACAYAIEGHIQKVELVTKGAHNSLCYIDANGLRYKVLPPQAVTINRSKEDLVIDCYAPGNRHRTVVVKPQTSVNALAGNAGTGFLPGMIWDYSSGAAYRYPSLIEIDFTGAPIVPEAMPDHNSPDVRQPEDYLLEEFKPGVPRMNSDRYQPKTEIMKRERQAPEAAAPYGENFIGEGTGGSDKGNLQRVSPSAVKRSASSGSSLEGSALPAASSAPLPLYPGQ